MNDDGGFLQKKEEGGKMMMEDSCRRRRRVGNGSTKWRVWYKPFLTTTTRETLKNRVKKQKKKGTGFDWAPSLPMILLFEQILIFLHFWNLVPCIILEILNSGTHQIYTVTISDFADYFVIPKGKLSMSQITFLFSAIPRMKTVNVSFQNIRYFFHNLLAFMFCF